MKRLDWLRYVKDAKPLTQTEKDYFERLDFDRKDQENEKLIEKSLNKGENNENNQ